MVSIVDCVSFVSFHNNSDFKKTRKRCRVPVIQIIDL